MERLREILKEIRKLGGRGYIVGGFVRDMLLGIESKDIDVEVYDMPWDTLFSLLANFGNVKECGESFKAIKLDNFDFSLPRKEQKKAIVKNSYKDFIVTLDSHMPMKEASRRRDLTINAMLYDLLEDRIHDFFGGQKDIERKILRHVDDRAFAEDALRVLRLAQFKARFEFDVHEDTIRLAKSLKEELSTLTRERVFTEVEKILLKARKPSIAFDFLLREDLLDIFPELKALVGIDQGTKHHPEGDVYRHTMLALDAVPMEIRDIGLMLAILVHDMGKALVEAEVDGDAVHFYGHESAMENAKTFLARLLFEEGHKTMVEEILTLTEFHMYPYTLKMNLKRKLVRRLALKVDVSRLMLLHRADKRGRTNVVDLSYIDEILALYQEIKDEIKPMVMGRHLIELGLKPSPVFGEILKKVFDAQIEGEISTFEEGIEMVKTLIS